MSRSPTYPLLRAAQWRCDDEVCDCSQYQITWVSPRPGQPRWYDLKRVWEGRFRSGTAELTRDERAELLREFRNAAHEHGIRLGRQEFGGWWGERPA